MVRRSQMKPVGISTILRLEDRRLAIFPSSDDEPFQHIIEKPPTRSMGGCKLGNALHIFKRKPLEL